MPLDPAVIKRLEAIVGRDRCTTLIEDRHCYAFDATKQKALPDVVVKASSTAEIAAVMRLANEHSVSVYPRGAGTGLVGGSIPLLGGIALVLAGMDRIVQIDAANLTATVEPGVVVTDLQTQVEKRGLFYPPDPASNATATMGGTVATCAGGLRCLKYGVTRDYVLALEVVLPTGEIIRTGARTLKSVTGYDLTRLFVGSEGTLGIFTKIVVRLIPLPPDVRALSAFFPDATASINAVLAIIGARIIPRTLELIDSFSLRAVQKYRGAEGEAPDRVALLVEVDGDVQSATCDIDTVARLCREQGAVEVHVAATADERERLWELRRSISPALYTLASTKINEDICVPRSRLPDLFAAIEQISRESGFPIAKFGHAGDGNVHVNLLLDDTRPEVLDRAHEAVRRVFEVTIALGGTLTGEHGIGLSKAEYLPLELGHREIRLMRDLKRLFDPNHILNPGKIFPDEVGAARRRP